MKYQPYLAYIDSAPLNILECPGMDHQTYLCSQECCNSAAGYIWW